MHIKEITFFKSYTSLSLMPKDNRIEVGFIGRSNVGKSSLLNNLCGKVIAKTSATPGKTRLINFFTVNREFYFVDLPGYGYAKVAKSQKQQWEKYIENYLANREQLKCIFFLLDIRRTPNEHDRMLSQWFKTLTGIEVVYILTKADKLSKSQMQQQKNHIAQELFVDQMELILYSTLKNMGRKEVLKRLDTFLV